MPLIVDMNVSTAAGMGRTVCVCMLMRGSFTGHPSTSRPAKQTIPIPYPRPHFARNRHIVHAVAGSDDQRGGLDRYMQQNRNGAGSQPSRRQRVRSLLCEGDWAHFPCLSTGGANSSTLMHLQGRAHFLEGRMPIWAAQLLLILFAFLIVAFRMSW